MLAEFWSLCAHRGFHPEDEPHIPPGQIIDWTTRDADARWDELKADKTLQHKVHRNLFPIPYMGNLESARVFILYGNPSLGKHSYEYEDSNEYVVRLHQENLHGTSKTFMDLDPQLLKLGGGKFWLRRFKHLAKDIADKKQIDRADAYSLIARRVAVLEACAYRSRRSLGEWAEELPSSKMIREYVHQVLVPRAKSGEILIFVWRCAAFWKVESATDHLITRPTRMAQLTYLLEQERTRILRMLGS